MKFKKGDRVVDEDGDKATVRGYTESGLLDVVYDDSSFNGHRENAGAYVAEQQFEFFEPTPPKITHVCTIELNTPQTIILKDYETSIVQTIFTEFWYGKGYLRIRTGLINTIEVKEV